VKIITYKLKKIFILSSPKVIRQYVFIIWYMLIRNLFATFNTKLHIVHYFKYFSAIKVYCLALHYSRLFFMFKAK